MKASVNDIDEQKWNNFIHDNKFETPFQRLEYHNFFKQQRGFLSKVYSVEEHGELKATCVVTLQKEAGLKGFFSRRAIIYGGPILEDGNGNALNLLLKTISDDLKGKTIYIETRNLNDYSEYRTIFESNNWNFQPYLNYQLDCSDEKVANQNLNTNRKRQIKKAIAKGATIAQAKNLDEVREFYEILRDLYKNKIKKPLLPLTFFESFFSEGMGKFLFVKHENKIIGGIVCPLKKGKAIYEFYICGLDQEYKEQSPSVMATYAAIEYGYKNGFRIFDFMGAGKPEEDYGVREFKEKFGGTLVEHGRFIKVNNQVLFTMGKTALSIMKQMQK